MPHTQIQALACSHTRALVIVFYIFNANSDIATWTLNNDHLISSVFGLAHVQATLMCACVRSTLCISISVCHCMRVLELIDSSIHHMHTFYIRIYTHWKKWNIITICIINIICIMELVQSVLCWNNKFGIFRISKLE